MPKILAICGYKRSGKNFFATNPENFLIYKRRDSSDLIVPPNSVQISNADYLKNVQIPSYLGIVPDYESIQNGECVKDILVINGKTIREHLKEIAMETKKKDKMFYARKTVEKVFLLSKENNPIVITDFRFPEEADCYSKMGLNWTSVRIFRKTVPIPDENDKTEHGLDKFLTDYLAVDNEESFDEACVLFPEYRTYVKQ